MVQTTLKQKLNIIRKLDKDILEDTLDEVEIRTG